MGEIVEIKDHLKKGVQRSEWERELVDRFLWASAQTTMVVRQLSEYMETDEFDAHPRMSLFPAFALAEFAKAADKLAREIGRRRKAEIAIDAREARAIHLLEAMSRELKIMYTALPQKLKCYQPTPRSSI